MEPIELLTLFGLIIAIYAIIPSERRAAIRLRLNWIDGTVITISIILLHYISYYTVLDELGLTFDLGAWRWGFNPANTSYLIVILTAIIVWIRTRSSRLGRAKINTLRELIEKLFFEEKYAEIQFLLERYYRSFFRILAGNFFIYSLRRKLIPSPIINIDIENVTHNNVVTQSTPRNNNSFNTFTKWIGQILPSGDQYTDSARDVARRLFTSRPFTAYLTNTRPYFVLNILDYKFHERITFVDIFIRSLLSQRNSVLYFEIRESGNMSSSYRYIIKQNNRVLHYFLSDASVADNLSVYKPLGDFALEYLNELSRTDNIYNNALGDYYDEGRWNCPLHIVIRFFDLMILEAMYQNIKWHMWVYYMPSIVKKIIKNISPNDDVDFSREWPTPYHSLLYEIVSAMCDWIEAVSEIPPDQENVKLDNQTLDHDNSNIPKSTILALGESMRYIMLTGTITIDFKVYLLEVVLNTIKDLRTEESTSNYAALLQSSITGGGFGLSDTQRKYKDMVLNVFTNLDIMLQREFRDFEQSLT